MKARIEICAEAIDVRLGLMTEAPLSITRMLKLGTLLTALGCAEAADRPSRIVAARRADDSRLTLGCDKFGACLTYRSQCLSELAPWQNTVLWPEA